MIEHTIIGTRAASVAYFNSKFAACDAADATLLKVIYQDTLETVFLSRAVGEETKKIDTGTLLIHKIARGRAVKVNSNRIGTRIMRVELSRIISTFLKEIREPLIKSVVSAVENVTKASALRFTGILGALEKARTTKAQIDEAMGLVDFSVLDKLPSRTRKVLEKIYADGGKEAIKITTAGTAIMHDDNPAWHQVHEDALSYAELRSAEMVGMKYDDKGELVENPNAEWAISDTTRDGIRESVSAVVEGDMPITELAGSLRDSYAFSESRANNIARTEFNKANGEGALAGYRANGIKYKLWLTSGDDKVSDECQANEDEGPIPVDEEFPSGGLTNPAHPQCRCSVAAHISFSDDDADETSDPTDTEE